MRRKPITSRCIEKDEIQIDTKALNRKAQQNERKAWGEWHIQLDLSFTKKQSEHSAQRTLKTFLRKMAEYQRLHLEYITYQGPQKNNAGSWHFHLYIRVKEEVSVDRLRCLLRAMAYEWKDTNGVKRNVGQRHKCFNGSLMHERLERYTAYNASELCQDATGFTYRVMGHQTDMAYPITVCPRRKRQCRKGRCEYKNTNEEGNA